MPRVNVWIRKEDWPSWEAIVDKPSFIHSAIQGDTLKDIFEGKPIGNDVLCPHHILWGTCGRASCKKKVE